MERRGGAGRPPIERGAALAELLVTTYQEVGEVPVNDGPNP